MTNPTVLVHRTMSLLIVSTRSGGLTSLRYRVRRSRAR
jgi:hypothetical protein